MSKYFASEALLFQLQLNKVSFGFLKALYKLFIIISLIENIKFMTEVQKSQESDDQHYDDYDY